MRTLLFASKFVLFAALLAATPGAFAQSQIARGGISLFSDFETAAPGARVFNGNFGGYGVSLATSDGATWLHGPVGASRLEARFSGNASESGALSLIGAYTVNQLRFAFDIRRDQLDFDRRRSSTEFGVGFMSAVGDSLMVGAGPTIGFGEVTPSRSSLRASGDSGAGARTLGLSGTATLSLSESWALTGVLGYRSRADGAKDESFFSIFGLGYRF